ncbi:MAG TPA: CcmD family protein [Candidatus Polarisedimenticolia bacterium]|nr:CcmD family protein [Candidatus Polarisedimenticolia bacterium]
METHFPYLFWAYNIIWLLIGGYVLTLGLRQRGIRRQIDRLREIINDKEAAS